jgi:Transposase, Mutator family
MAEGHRMTAADLVDKLMADEHADMLRDSVAWLVTQLMEAEVGALTGAELGERAPERRQAQRNGYRQRRWDTRVGELELAIPRLRTGSYFPSFLEPRRRAEQALVAVVQEAYVNGISTRKVDRLVEQLGLHHMGKDQVSRLCRGLDEQVSVFRERPLAGAYPYLWLDAKVERVREPGGVRHKALVIAYGVHETGRREVVGLDSGRPRPRRSGGRSCGRCALVGWRGSSWSSPTPTPASSRPSPRCSAVPGSAAPSTSSETCWATSPGPSSRWCRGRSGASSPPPRPLKPTSGWVRSSTSSVPTPPRSPRSWRTPRWTCWPSTGFRPSTGPSCAPPTPWSGSTGRSAAAPTWSGFPNDAALLRLAGMLLLEQNDEWLVGRRYLSETSMTLVLAEATDHDREEALELTAS